MPLVNVGAQTLSYVSRGGRARPTVVFIHGAGGSHLVWGSQLAYVASSWRAIAPDLPGHGRSGGPGRDSIADYAQVVVSFLDALRLGPVVVVGHSMGGAIALSLALDAPERVAGLVLVGTGARLRVAPAVLDAIRTDFSAAVGLVGQFAFGPEPAGRLVRLSELAMCQAGQRTVYGDFAACDAFDVRSRLQEIVAPALVLTGSEDRLTPPRYAEYLASGIRGASLKIVEGAGHMVMLEAAAAVNQAIGGFLESLPERKASVPAR